MPTDQRLEDGQSLAFYSAPLSEPMEILGAPVVALDVAVDRPSAFLAVRLNDVAEDGASTQVTYGLLNLAHGDNHAAVEALEPGRRNSVRVQLNDIAHAFPAGHRIRVAVSTTYWPRAWPSPEPVTLTLFTGASRLELPVRPPRAEDAGLTAFLEPEAAPPAPSRTRGVARRGRFVRHEMETGRIELESIKARGDVFLEDIDLTVGAGGVDRFEIVGDDPLSARHENRYTIVMERAGWSIRTEAYSVLTATRDDFLVSATLDAYEGDCRVFTKTWDRRIPRDGV